MTAVPTLRGGALFDGEGPAPPADGTGEVVFNTAMSGYEEILTDTSYHRQIVVLTQPEIGNYGITLADEESLGGPKVSGLIIREYNPPSNHRARLSLEDYLASHHISAMSKVDTRRLT